MAAGAQSASLEVRGAQGEQLLEQLAAAEQRAKQAEQIARLADLKIQKLTLDLAYYKRLHYAAKSEHYHGEQLELFEQDMGADLAAIEAAQETLPPVMERPKRSQAGR